MPTYVYETLPAASGGEVQRFEYRQAMSDPPLETHPETGEPVRRVITGGLGYLGSRQAGPGGAGGGGG